MKMKLITSCGIGVALMIGAAACVSARGLSSDIPNVACLGSNPPIIGDRQTACRYIVLGAHAFAKGDWLEAKGDYRTALEASPFDLDATLGLARCAVAERDFKTAVRLYHTVAQCYPYDIDLASEYTLALQQAGLIPEAVSCYNHTLSLCKEGRNEIPMEVYPAAFLENGSDYDPVEMASMTHLMLAMNSGSDDVKRQASEMDKARSLAPQSSIVHYYVNVWEQQAKKLGAKRPLRVAMALNRGVNAKAPMKHVKQ